MQTNNSNNINNNPQQYRIRINHFIRVPQVRVILSDGSNGGIMATHEALKLAKEENLDLIEINPKAIPPVVKIANFGKMMYEEKKKQQIAKKNQIVQELKEISFRPTTDNYDLNHKLELSKEFLSKGHKIKFTCKFRGREISHPEIGKDKFFCIIEQLQNLIIENPPISMEGKIMSMTVYPVKHNK